MNANAIDRTAMAPDAERDTQLRLAAFGHSGGVMKVFRM